MLYHSVTEREYRILKILVYYSSKCLDLDWESDDQLQKAVYSSSKQISPSSFLLAEYYGCTIFSDIIYFLTRLSSTALSHFKFSLPNKNKTPSKRRGRFPQVGGLVLTDAGQSMLHSTFLAERCAHRPCPSSSGPLRLSTGGMFQLKALKGSSELFSPLSVWVPNFPLLSTCRQVGL